MSVSVGQIVVMALLVQGSKCLEFEGIEKPQQGYSEYASDEAVRRVKRQLTTICMEIKPSGPKEEPYFMCKGAELPKFPNVAQTTPQPYSTAQYAGGNSAPPFKQDYQPAFPQPASTPYSDGHSQADSKYGAEGGAHFQTPTPTPIKTSINNYQSFPGHDSSAHYSSSSSGNGKAAPALHHDTHEGYPHPSYYSQHKQHQQQQQQTFPVPHKSTFPAYEAPTPSYYGPQTHAKLPGYESLYEAADYATTARPALAPKPATRFGSSGKGYATSYAGPKTQVPETPYSHTHETQPAADGPAHAAGGSYASTPTYNSYERPAASHGPASYAHSPAAPALPAAETEKSSAAKAAPHSAEIVAGAPSFRFAARPAAVAADHPYVAAARAASAADFLKPAGGATRGHGNPHLSEGTRYGGGSQSGASYQLPSSRTPYAAPFFGRRNFARPSALPQPPAAAADRYRTITLDDEVFGMPDWGFSAEELSFLRGAAPAAPADEAAHSIPPRISPQLQARTPQIPQEYMDDPVMQTFYASLPVATPVSPQLAAPPAENPLLSVNYFVGRPAEHAARNSYKPAKNQASCIPYEGKPTSSPSCAPSVSTISGCGGTPSQAASQQYGAASDTEASYVAPGPASYNCKSSCHSHAPNIQPVIIALPCYGQATPTGGYNQHVAAIPAYVPAATHNSPVTYNQVGMPTPGLGLFGRPLGGGLLNLGINPFWRPFDVLGLVNTVRQNVGLANPNLGMPYQQPGIVQQGFAGHNQQLGAVNQQVGAANQGVGGTIPNAAAPQQNFGHVNANPFAAHTHAQLPPPNLAAGKPSGVPKTISRMPENTQPPKAASADVFNLNAFLSTRTPPQFPESSEFSESVEEKQTEPEASAEFNSESEEADSAAETDMESLAGTTKDDRVTDASTTVTPPPNSSEQPKAGFSFLLVTEPPLTTVTDEVLPHLEEESLKTYKSLLNAARSFSQDAKAEAAAIDAELSTSGNAEGEGRMRKRQNAKAGTGSNGYKRKYVQKL